MVLVYMGIKKLKVVDISDFSNGKNKKNFELLPAEEFI